MNPYSDSMRNRALPSLWPRCGRMWLSRKNWFLVSFLAVFLLANHMQKNGRLSTTEILRHTHSELPKVDRRHDNSPDSLKLRILQKEEDPSTDLLVAQTLPAQENQNQSTKAPLVAAEQQQTFAKVSRVDAGTSCLIHVGKTGGSLVSCVLGFGTFSCPTGSEIYNRFAPERKVSAIAKHIGKSHAHVGQVTCSPQTDTFLVPIRNPLARFKSWWHHERISQAKRVQEQNDPNDKHGYWARGFLFLDCYPTLEALVREGLSHNVTNQDIAVDTRKMTCPQRAWAMATGDRAFSKHNWHNYEYYYHLSQELASSKPARMFVVRNEYLAKDWNTVDYMFGGNGSHGESLFSTQVNKNPKNKGLLPPDVIEKLCEALCVDIQYYKRFLLEAENLNEQDVAQSLAELQFMCPNESNTIRSCPGLPTFPCGPSDDPFIETGKPRLVCKENPKRGHVKVSNVGDGTVGKFNSSQTTVGNGTAGKFKSSQSTVEDVLFNANFTDFKLARSRHRKFGRKLIEYVATRSATRKRDNVTWSLASLAYNTETSIKTANEVLRFELHQILENATVSTLETTVEGPLTWRMRSWVRIYYLFSSKSKHFPGRLENDVEDMTEQLFFMFSYIRSSVQLSNVTNIWFIEDFSENHDIMMKVNVYMSVQAIQNLPKYREKKMVDGREPAEHVKAWEKYYERYALERSKLGLLAEAASPPYGKWVMGEFVNMYDFAESSRVRTLIGYFLNAIWADWAIDQYEGYRTGPKNRCYPNYLDSGLKDSYSLMGRDLLGVEPWIGDNYGMQSSLILATSNYSMPDIVMDLALNKGRMKPFVYQSTRPGVLQMGLHKTPSPTGLEGNWMNGTAGKLLRYSYHTPSYNMGSWTLDSSLTYAAISTQNRFHGVTFSSSPDRRVVPWSMGLAQDGRTSYNAHTAVQHRNVMVVAPHPKRQQAGGMRTFFAQDFRDRLHEKDGWVIIQERDAWLGVRMLNRGEKLQPNVTNYMFVNENQTLPWKANGFWMHPKIGGATTIVAMVGSQLDSHKTLDDFCQYLAGHEFSVNDRGRVVYSYHDDLGEKTELGLGGTLRVPTANGIPVEMVPEKTFESPWVTSNYNSGIIRIHKGDREMVLDFNPQQDANAVAI